MKLKTKQLIFYILFVFVMLGVGLCYYNSYVNETFVNTPGSKVKDCIEKICDKKKGLKGTIEKCKNKCTKLK